MTVTRKQVRQPGDPLPRDYFSLLDPDSTSMNFDTLEGKPYLYFVQYTEDRRYRDLYRVPIAIK
jgi:cytochrome oxidase Cu insertion factor (SCO1/SenC/PrrC family)